jgi:hypothetical protein
MSLQVQMNPSHVRSILVFPTTLAITLTGNNLGLADQLNKLRDDTKHAYDEAQALKERWKYIEREQTDLSSVS